MPKRKRITREEPKKFVPPFCIDSLEKLIDFAWNYKGDNVDWFTLWKLIPVLEELNDMVGMKKLKSDIVNLIMYYTQGLHISYDANGKRVDEGDMLHTALMGPPGCGKTSVAHILTKIYSSLGFLSKGHVTVVKRTDFIGKFVGHSEHQTAKLLEKCKGGVMFIDEAYNLGSPGDKDCTFSSAALNELNAFLSENKNDFICIIAGYKKDLETSFFSVNPGLSRRFPWRFEIENYSKDEYIEIFRRIVIRNRWKIKEIPEKMFEQKFENAGGDMENLFSKCKIAHTKRIFGQSSNENRLLTRDDIEQGFKMLQFHSKKIVDDRPPDGMYI